MPTLTECKTKGWLRPHHIRQIEDDIAKYIRAGRPVANGILMCINWADWDQIDPAALTGPTHTANIIVEKSDVAAVREKLEAAKPKQRPRSIFKI
jgi:hypothetical protein